MLQTAKSFNGMVSAPHHLASLAGQRVLRDGGNAIEAMIAAASTIAVVYPHMNSLGGDNFWLIKEPGKEVIGIDSCGGAAAIADVNYYKKLGHSNIPSRGPLAALTCAGAVSGWDAALKISKKSWGGRFSLQRLLEDSIFYAEDGIAVTQTQANNTKSKLSELKHISSFEESFLINGDSPAEGAKFYQKKLAETLKELSLNGLDAFYRGKLAKKIASDLESAGSPLRLIDLERHVARSVTPLSIGISGQVVCNMPPPTQGLASLMILGLINRLGPVEAENSQFVHNIIEATKIAFKIRDTYISDPDYMSVDPKSFLDSQFLDNEIKRISPSKASNWPASDNQGDTVWLGAVDRDGRVVSFIQSIYWEFGSGVVLDETGITWQNRGMSFSLDDQHHNVLKPYRRPFHTIQPALASLSDGRTMVYGTMGGEGQPQTQAMVFNRYVTHGHELQKAVTSPRWLLGRTWGSMTNAIRIEDRFDQSVYEELRGMGHDLKLIGEFDEIMGHAGALVHHPSGLIEGACDPRSDGFVSAF